MPGFRCVQPFRTLTIYGNGRITPCQVIREEFGTVGDQSLQSIWKSPQLRKLRQQHAAGEIPKACQECALAEEHDFWSRRERVNHFHKSRMRIADSDWETSLQKITEESTPKIREIDLAFSRTCNLHCSTCSTEFSSSWQALDKRYANEMPTERREEIAGIQAKNPISTDFVKELLGISADLDSLKIKGGEPLLDPNCLAYLERLPKTGFNGEVWLVTNASRLSEKVLQILGKVPGLNLSVSVDGHGEVFEWIRGFDFAKVEQNIASLLSLPSLHKLKLAFTTSGHSVWRLPEFLRWERRFAKQDKYAGAYFTQYAAQNYMHTANIPIEYRLRIAEAALPLLESTYSEKALQNIKNALTSKHEMTSQQQADFFQWIDICDRHRKQSLLEIVPELKKIRQQMNARGSFVSENQPQPEADQ